MQNTYTCIFYNSVCLGNVNAVMIGLLQKGLSALEISFNNHNY